MASTKQTPLRGLAWRPILGVLIVMAMSLAAVAETPFVAECKAAMEKMMRDMEIAPSGDVDRDFVAMMIPHHQGAIEMAQAELRHGRNERLRRLAQEIIIEQTQEIAVMRLELGQPAQATRPSAESSR
jgi:uncharacterized protein (DUF305 family)